MGPEPESEPQRVASGGFLIDRRRALEVLGRFQLSSPFLFVLPWVRAAVACGAEEVEVADLADRFELRFVDPRGFSEAELSGLLEHLPAERAAAPVRELARGALSALRCQGGAEVRVRSGPPAARWRLTLSAESEACVPCQELESRTVLGVGWGAKGRPKEVDTALRFLRRSCRLRLVRFQGEAEHAGGLPPGLWKPFACEGLEGWLEEGRPGLPSELLLYKLGVACATAQAWLAGPQVRALAEESRLTLSLDQAATVDDEVLREAVRKVGLAAEDLARRRLREVSEALPALGGWLRDPEAYALWKRSFTPERAAVGGLELALQRAFALDAGTAAGRLGELARWAPIVAWLRDTALRVLGDGRTPRTPLEQAVWEAPLYLTVEGLPLSVQELDRQQREGRLSIGNRKFSGEPEHGPDLAVSSRLEMLRLLAGSFGDRLAT